MRLRLVRSGPNAPAPSLFRVGNRSAIMASFLRLDLLPATGFPRSGFIGAGDNFAGPMIDRRAAMLAAFCTPDVVVDVANGGEVARPAVGAPLHTAVGREGPFERSCQLSLQELFR